MNNPAMTNNNFTQRIKMVWFAVKVRAYSNPKKQFLDNLKGKNNGGVAQ